ncbi:hypothetical protein [Streptomyces spiramyceticus]|uniref:hypothetical protein n=1 Tax=Streptomyces spiramyceticus TaxID=299717 RepID=UPI00237C3648|nr:hypothetical protein [Streptomyces spiramyceticus]
MISGLSLLLRHAPSAVVPALLDRLDARQRYELLALYPPVPQTVNHVLSQGGSPRDRVALARNRYSDRALLLRLMECGEYEVDRSVYFHRRTTGAMRRAIAPAPHEPVLATLELVELLRGHQRVRHALRILDRPHVLDPHALLSEHRRRPLPPGAVEALVLSGECPRAAVLALLDTRGTRTYGRWWYRPAVRAVRTGAITPAELVRHMAPAHRTLLLPTVRVRGGLRLNDAEAAAVREETGRVLHPVLSDRIEDWTDFGRRAHTFDGTLPELAAATGHISTGGPEIEGLSSALLDALPVRREPCWDPLARADALKALARLDTDSRPQYHLRKQALADGLLTGDDIVLHGAPARAAIDEKSWLGHLEHFDRPQAVVAARTRTTELARAALGEDPEAWWAVARRLPKFEGTFPELLGRGFRGDSLSAW